MSSRNTPSKVEPDAKRHKLDDQNESSDNDGSIIDTTLASEDADDDDGVDTTPLIDNGKSVREVQRGSPVRHERPLHRGRARIYLRWELLQCPHQNGLL